MSYQNAILQDVQASLTGDLLLESKEIFEKIPRDFPGGDALRETFLLQLPEDFAKHLRSLLVVVLRSYEEIETKTYGGSLIKGELLAASRDLRHLASFLSQAAYNMIDQASPAERELIGIADRLAVELHVAAEMIDSRVLIRRRPKPAGSAPNPINKQKQ